jgi:hypothetical protein
MSLFKSSSSIYIYGFAITGLDCCELEDNGRNEKFDGSSGIVMEPLAEESRLKTTRFGFFPEPEPGDKGF